MTFAVAIAYDWLYDRWNDEQREQLRAGILRAGAEAGTEGVPRREAARVSLRENNWNQVCNGGMLAGALAIAEDEPGRRGRCWSGRSGRCQSRWRSSRPTARGARGRATGPYATEYNCIALAALRSATGTDFGLSEMPGFSRTGDMPLAFTGPIGLTFNYADAGPGLRRRAATLLARLGVRHAGVRGVPDPVRQGRPAAARPALGRRVVRERAGIGGSPARPDVPQATTSSTSAAPGAIRAPCSSRSRAATTASATPTSTSARSSSTRSASAGRSTSAPTITTAPATSARRSAGPTTAAGPRATTACSLTPAPSPTSPSPRRPTSRSFHSDARPRRRHRRPDRRLRAARAGSVRRGFALLDGASACSIQDEVCGVGGEAGRLLVVHAHRCGGRRRRRRRRRPRSSRRAARR